MAFRRLQAEHGVRLRYLLRCKGLARSPLYLTLPFRLGGVPPRQGHETEAAVEAQRLALTEWRSIGLTGHGPVKVALLQRPGRLCLLCIMTQ